MRKAFLLFFTTVLLYSTNHAKTVKIDEVTEYINDTIFKKTTIQYSDFFLEELNSSCTNLSENYFLNNHGNLNYIATFLLLTLVGVIFYITYNNQIKKSNGEIDNKYNKITNDRNKQLDKICIEIVKDWKVSEPKLKNLKPILYKNLKNESKIDITLLKDLEKSSFKHRSFAILISTIVIIMLFLVMYSISLFGGAN